jgi:ubiquinone/menaquinone biosynthesis C-methylase UbiE
LRSTSAVDVGCGAGTEIVFLAQCGYRCVGVDLAPAALAVARDRADKAGVEVDLREGSVLELPVEAESVDFVNDRGCFHHIRESDRGTYARELARVMRPGGVVVLRGARSAEGPFVVVSPDVIERVFGGRYFRLGPVLPIELDSDSGRLASSMVVLRRTVDALA